MTDTPIGEPEAFVDTQGFKLLLKNTQDANTQSFTQVLSLVPAKIEHSVDFNQLTNDTVEKVLGLTNAAFDVKLMLTQSEISLLLNLSLSVNAIVPTRFWTIEITDVSGNKTNVEGNAVVSKFDMIDPGVGLATAEIILDFVSGTQVTEVLRE